MMNCSMAKRVLILLWGAGAGLYPLISFALGLGDLQIESRLNQPLRARIEVSDVSDDEWRLVRAHLASQTSQEGGLSRPGLLESVTFKNVEDENHRRFIEVKSAEVFTEPLFDLSIQVSGADFDVTRNYTVFLDPPRPNDDLPGTRGPALVSQPAVPAKQDVGAVARADASKATDQGSGSSAPRKEPSLVIHSGRKKVPTAGTSAGGVTAPPASAGAGAVTVPPANVAQGNVSGPSYVVTKADTLEKIARRFGGTAAAQRNQFMDWVFQHNPAAFYGDMNRLRAGARLALPGNAVVAIATGPGSAVGSNSTTAGSKGVGATLPAAVGQGSGAQDSGGQVAKAQLQGELTDLQQELTGLQKMLARQDAQIASLKQQIATREEQQRSARAGRTSVEESDVDTEPKQAPRPARRASDEQSEVAKSTAALVHADEAGVTPPEEQISAGHAVEQSNVAQSASATESTTSSGSDPAHANSLPIRSQPPGVESRTDAMSSSDQGSADIGASRRGVTGLWARYRLKTSVYYWAAAIGVMAALIVWLVFYIRRRMEEANPVVHLRYEIGPTFERSPEAAQARGGLSETLPMTRPTGSASAAAKLSAALKRSELEDTAETEVGHEEAPQEPQSGLDTWRTQTALLEQDILSETDVLPFVLDTRNQLKTLDEELLSPSELTRQSEEIVMEAPTEKLPEISAPAPTERLPRMVAEEIAERAPREQAARQKAADEKVPRDASQDADARDGEPRGAGARDLSLQDEAARDQPAKGKSARPSAETLENTADLPVTNKEIVKALESSLDYHPDRVDIQLKLLEIYHHEALDNRENFHSMLRRLSDLKNLSPAQRLHVEMLQRTLQDGDSSFVAEEEI